MVGCRKSRSVGRDVQVALDEAEIDEVRGIDILADQPLGLHPGDLVVDRLHLQPALGVDEGAPALIEAGLALVYFSMIGMSASASVPKTRWPAASRCMKASA